MYLVMFQSFFSGSCSRIYDDFPGTSLYLSFNPFFSWSCLWIRIIADWLDGNVYDSIFFLVDLACEYISSKYLTSWWDIRVYITFGDTKWRQHFYEPAPMLLYQLDSHDKFQAQSVLLLTHIDFLISAKIPCASAYLSLICCWSLFISSKTFLYSARSTRSLHSLHKFRVLSSSISSILEQLLQTSLPQSSHLRMSTMSPSCLLHKSHTRNSVITGIFFITVSPHTLSFNPFFSWSCSRI